MCVKSFLNFSNGGKSFLRFSFHEVRSSERYLVSELFSFKFEKNILHVNFTFFTIYTAIEIVLNEIRRSYNDPFSVVMSALHRTYDVSSTIQRR